MTAPPRDVRITDSTLRDGSHAMRHRFTEEQVRTVVSALEDLKMEYPKPKMDVKDIHIE